MQKDIHKEDYFQVLMCALVDESRKLLPTFNPMPEAYRINSEMSKAGSYVEMIPGGTIIQTVPQDFVKKLEKTILPEYRRLAASLIDHFIDSFEKQGGDRNKITEHFERMYKWKK